MIKRIPLPLALQVFALLPVGATAYRIGQLMGGAANDTAFELAIHSKPAVFLVHILAASLFAILAAFQVAPGFRSARLRMHKRMGYVGWAAGVVMATSGMWLVLGFPIADGSLLATQVIRMVFGAGLLWLLLDGLCSALRRDIARHRAQMTRAYALGVVSTTTNAMIFGVWAAAMGDLTAQAFTVLLTVGWAGSLIGAQLWLGRGARRLRPA